MLLFREVHCQTSSSKSIATGAVKLECIFTFVLWLGYEVPMSGRCGPC